LSRCVCWVEALKKGGNNEKEAFRQHWFIVIATERSERGRKYEWKRSNHRFCSENPIGRIGVSLIYETEKRGLKLEFAALCGGGGPGQAIRLERI
jgi:hypothetical protein